MQRLLQFLFRYRVFILFLFIEGVCSIIIVKNNSYQGAKYLSASNTLSASVLGTANDVGDYFNLKTVNQDLAAENARLRQTLFHLMAVDSTSPDSIAALVSDTLGRAVKAKVVDNSLFFRNNYLVIDKGAEDGAFPGQGVVGPNGIVGKVQRTSDEYSTVLSLLHSKTLISARHNESGYLCSVVWEGESPYQANVRYLPRHLDIAIGDTIVTSGFNSVYHENSPIGVVNDVGLGSESAFYDVTIDLATDFSKLSFVYLLDLKGRQEIDSLKTESQQDG